MYQLMVSGGASEFSTMTLTSGANRWASRAVIVLQLAAWSAVGIVLLQKGVTSLQKAAPNRNSSQAISSDHFGVRRATEAADLSTIPLHEEFPAKVDEITSEDAWLKHRNELAEYAGTKRAKDLDSKWPEGPDAVGPTVENLEAIAGETRSQSKETTTTMDFGAGIEEILHNQARNLQNDRQDDEINAQSPVEEENALADTEYTKKVRKKAKLEDSPEKRADNSKDELPDRAFLTEEIPARISKTIANERSVEDRTIPLRVLDKSERVFYPGDYVPRNPRKKMADDQRNANENNTSDPARNSQNHLPEEEEEEEGTESVGRLDLNEKESARNDSAETMTTNSQGQETAWDSRKRMRLSHLSGGGAAAAVAMVAVGAVMLILGPAVIVLRALDERRQERRFLKLSGQDDLPPTYEQATLMDEAPRYSTLSLNTILGPPPPPSPSPTLARAHLV